MLWPLKFIKGVHPGLKRPSIIGKNYFQILTLKLFVWGRSRAISFKPGLKRHFVF
jgi:hypothetical protein